jgi:hypothetical protein
MQGQVGGREGVWVERWDERVGGGERMDAGKGPRRNQESMALKERLANRLGVKSKGRILGQVLIGGLSGKPLWEAGGRKQG